MVMALMVVPLMLVALMVVVSMLVALIQASHLYIGDCIHVHDSILQIQCSIVYWDGP